MGLGLNFGPNHSKKMYILTVLLKNVLTDILSNKCDTSTLLKIRISFSVVKNRIFPAT